MEWGGLAALPLLSALDGGRVVCVFFGKRWYMVSSFTPKYDGKRKLENLLIEKFMFRLRGRAELFTYETLSFVPIAFASSTATLHRISNVSDVAQRLRRIYPKNVNESYTFIQLINFN